MKREYELGSYARLISDSGHITEEWLREKCHHWLCRRPSEQSNSVPRAIRDLGNGSRDLPPLALTGCLAEGAQPLLVNAINSAIRTKAWLELGLILKQVELWHRVLHRPGAERPWWELQASWRSNEDMPQEVLHVDTDTDLVQLEEPGASKRAQRSVEDKASSHATGTRNTTTTAAGTTLQAKGGQSIGVAKRQEESDAESEAKGEEFLRDDAGDTKAECMHCRKPVWFFEEAYERTAFRSCIPCADRASMPRSGEHILCTDCYRGCDVCELSLCPPCMKLHHSCKKCGAACSRQSIMGCDQDSGESPCGDCGACNECGKTEDEGCGQWLPFTQRSHLRTRFSASLSAVVLKWQNSAQIG